MNKNAGRLPNVSVNYMLQRIPEILKSNNLTGEEIIVSAGVVVGEMNPEYANGTFLLRLMHPDGQTGVLSIAPEKLSALLN